MKNKVWLVLFSYLFCSCDWYGDYHYEIRNELENDTILVEALYFKDTTFIIPPMEQLRIRSVASGNIGKDTDPPDIFTKELSDFDSIKIYWNNTLIEKNFIGRQYWNFIQNSDQSSTYLLIINKNLLE